MRWKKVVQAIKECCKVYEAAFHYKEELGSYKNFLYKYELRSEGRMP